MASALLQKRIDDLEAQLQDQAGLAAKLADVAAQASQERDRAAKAEERVKELEDSSPSTTTLGQRSTVYVSRDRRLPKLKGVPREKDDPDVGEWVTDMRAILHSRPMPKREAAEFIFEHLAGDAKKEVRHRPDDVRTDPEELLKVVETVFGDRSALPKLFERFYKREQGPKEGLLEYSIALASVWGKIEGQLDPNSTSSQSKDKTLKDRLTEGVHDQHLRRELRRLNIEEPSLSFWEFRERGLKWLGASDSQVPVAVRETSTQPATDKTTKEILELLQQQQVELKELREEMHNLQLTRREYNAVCFRCGSPEHFIRDCTVPQGTPRGRGRGRGGNGRGGGRGRPREYEGNTRSQDTADHQSGATNEGPN